MVVVVVVVVVVLVVVLVLVVVAEQVSLSHDRRATHGRSRRDRSAHDRRPAHACAIIRHHGLGSRRHHAVFKFRVDVERFAHHRFLRSVGRSRHFCRQAVDGGLVLGTRSVVSLLVATLVLVFVLLLLVVVVIVILVVVAEQVSLSHDRRATHGRSRRDRSAHDRLAHACAIIRHRRHHHAVFKFRVDAEGYPVRIEHHALNKVHGGSWDRNHTHISSRS